MFSSTRIGLRADVSKFLGYYIGRQIRPNQSGLTQTLNGGDFVVAAYWLFENRWFDGESLEPKAVPVRCRDRKVISRDSIAIARHGRTSARWM